MRRRRLAAQIDLIDQDIENVRDPEVRCKLITAKARLWELLYPKPGSLRPKAGRPERAPILPIEPIPQAQPVDSNPALVVQPTDEEKPPVG